MERTPYSALLGVRLVTNLAALIQPLSRGLSVHGQGNACPVKRSVHDNAVLLGSTFCSLINVSRHRGLDKMLEILQAPAEGCTFAALGSQLEHLRVVKLTPEIGRCLDRITTHRVLHTYHRGG